MYFTIYKANIMEIWKDIIGYEGLYQVSDLGRVKSLNYNKKNISNILKDRVPGARYASVVLCKGKEHKRFLVHRLVWETFKGPIPAGYEINHNDENTFNNRLDNLSLMNHLENMRYGSRTERVAKKRSIGIIQYGLDGTKIKEWESAKQAVEQNPSWSRGNISSCCHGTRKSANGYIWKFA